MGCSKNAQVTMINMDAELRQDAKALIGRLRIAEARVKELELIIKELTIKNP